MIRYLRRGFCRNKMQYCINKKILDIENSPLTGRKEIVMIFTGIFAVVYGIFMIIFGFTKNMNIIGASVWIALLAVIPYFLLCCSICLAVFRISPLSAELYCITCLAPCCCLSLKRSIPWAVSSLWLMQGVLVQWQVWKTMSTL